MREGIKGREEKRTRKEDLEDTARRRGGSKKDGTIKGKHEGR